MQSGAVKISLVACLAAVLAASATGAEQRYQPRRGPAYDHYYAGPEFLKGIPGLRVLFGDYALTEDEYNELYGTPGAERFDESYYEPRAKVPAAANKKPAATSSRNAPAKKTATGSAATENRAPAARAAGDKQMASSGDPAAAALSADKSKAAARPATSSISCGKAGEIVSGYGFSGVTPQSCNGKLYAFTAMRDGKSFAIKLDPASGELAEVKKLQ
jgi:hypothetical protein